MGLPKQAFVKSSKKKVYLSSTFPKSERFPRSSVFHQFGCSSAHSTDLSFFLLKLPNKAAAGGGGENRGGIMRFSSHLHLHLIKSLLIKLPRKPHWAVQLVVVVTYRAFSASRSAQGLLVVIVVVVNVFSMRAS